MKEIKMKRRQPTVKELENILESKEEKEIITLPNGEIRTRRKWSPLQEKIEEYLTPEIGVAIRDACDLIIRLRLGQLNIVAETLKKYCSLHQEGKGVDIDEPLYKGVELGEYLMCLEEHPNCLDAKECWITRKGFAKCREEEKGCCGPIGQLLEGRGKRRKTI